MINVYSTMSRQKEPLKVENNKIKLFVCGPTVYDYSHIGHARTYISFDVIVRYLKHEGYSVFYLQNITDIDDKIINRAKDIMFYAWQFYLLLCEANDSFIDDIGELLAIDKLIEFPICTKIGSK